jgi:hypothetical protein
LLLVGLGCPIQAFAKIATPPQASDFEQFLLDSPEMSDDEYQAIEEKRQHLKEWK